MTAVDYWIDRLEEESEPARLHPIVVARRNIRVVRGMIQSMPMAFTRTALDVILKELDEAAKELVIVAPLPPSIPPAETL